MSAKFNRLRIEVAETEVSDSTGAEMSPHRGQLGEMEQACDSVDLYRDHVIHSDDALLDQLLLRGSMHNRYRNVVVELQGKEKVVIRKRLGRPLSRRESVRRALHAGSVRAARVASMIVVPSNMIDKDTKVEDWIEKYTCLPPPIFMILVSLVEIYGLCSRLTFHWVIGLRSGKQVDYWAEWSQLAVFIGYAVAQSDRRVATCTVNMTSGVPDYSPLIYQPTRRYEAWRFFTYMLIHSGYMHIVGNVLFQLLIGLPLEMVHGFVRVLTIYLVGVLAGSLASSVVDPWVLLCGASGGCYSLLGAQFATITMNWKEMKSGMLNSAPKFLTSGPFQLVFWLVLAILFTLISVHSRFSGGRTSFAAHIIGLITGYLVGLCVLKNFDDRSWKFKLRVTSFVIFGVFFTFAIFFNTLHVTYYPPTDWRQCCPPPPFSWYSSMGYAIGNQTECTQSTDSLANVSSPDTSPTSVLTMTS